MAKRRSPVWWRWTKIVSVVMLIVISLLVVIFGAMFYPHLKWAEAKVMSLEEIATALNTEPSVILSADGKVLYRAQTEYRKPVKFNEIPRNVIDATLAAEDERFYEHRGIDYIGMGRALATNVSDRRINQGASTITMQLAKRLFTSTDKSLERKMKDMALAIQIERIKTKDEILKLYLNNVFYGAGAYGVGAAASVYFGKRLNQLTLAESALLARLVQRPTEYNPFRNPDLALEKRNVVLAVMHKNGMITDAEYKQAREEPLKLRQASMASGEHILDSPYFVNYILDTVRRTHPDIDITRGGYRIETTIDTRLQNIAERAVRRVVAANRRRDVTTGAFVLMDNEGKILAMVGGVDYERNQYNVIAQGKRQPGSAMKPFVYAAALSSGAISRHESISNEPYYLETHEGRKRWPKGGGTGGSVSVRRALAASINVPAVRVMEKVTPRRAVQYCESVFGFTSRLDPVLALVLGSSAVSPLEMAQAYSVFMLYGDRAKPFGIKRLVAPDGTIIDDFGPHVQKNLLDPQVCEFMDDCLRATVTGGTAKRARGVPNARGKTGTTSDNRDAWFCGYTNNLVGVAWVANERFVNGKPTYPPMRDVFGGEVSVLIWGEVMQAALRLFDDSRTHEKKGRKPPPSIDESTAPVPVEEIPRDPQPRDEGPPPSPEPDPDEPVIVPPPTPDRTPGDQQPARPKRDPGQEPPEAGVEEPGWSIEICVETGRTANAYCPETVTRRFTRGSTPPRCRRHGPP